MERRGRRNAGVSYLALTQWRAASTRPPSLRAIVPWEGFTDAYRGLVRPGGVRENGFLRLWDLGFRKVRQTYSPPGARHPHTGTRQGARW